jgi:hypothetical protein
VRKRNNSKRRKFPHWNSKTKTGGTSPTETEKERTKVKEKEKEVLSSTRTTRSADAKGGRLSREEMEISPGQEITNSKEGMQYLKSMLLTIPGNPYTTGELVTALFQTSMLPGNKVNQMNTNTICAIAFILSDVNLDSKVKKISEAVMARLDDQIKTLMKETEAVTAVIEEKVTIKADYL